MKSHRLLAVFAAGCAALQWIACSAAGGPTAAGTGGGGASSSSSAAASSVSASKASVAASVASSGSGGSGGGPCKVDADCAAPGKPHCDVVSGACFECLPGADTCAAGSFCDSKSLSCAPGCKTAADCASKHCDGTHTCVECLVDGDCAVGSVCIGVACAPGCSDVQACPGGLTCCGKGCVDVTKNVLDCGVCSNACAPPPNATAVCVASKCGLGACVGGFEDCDLDPANGCEENSLQDGPCKCTPGTQISCYEGAPGTIGVGPCHAGIKTCNADGLAFGACAGEVLPSADICANSIDEDCNGVVDDGQDNDGDGWKTCDGDCCDDPAQCPGGDPKLVNPGAFEIIGNGINDDCDVSTSDVVPAAGCSTISKFDTVTAIDVAKAIDLCQFTTANPPLAQKKWGVITADQLLAAGTVPPAAALANMQNWQTAVLQNYGSVVPNKGATVAGIMSGEMRDAGDPGFVAPNPGTDFGTTSSPPLVYLNAHAGQLPASQGCSGACVAGSGANDSVNIRLSIRVPTNAKAFSYNSNSIPRSIGAFPAASITTSSWRSSKRARRGSPPTRTSPSIWWAIRSA